MIRIAIVGTGGISHAHIKAYLQFTERCKIAALVDIIPGRAQHVKEQYGLDADVYQDYLGGREYIYAKLVAGDNKKEMASVFSYSFDNRTGGCWTPDNQHWYPNNMESAAAAFGNGAYWNSMEFTIDDEQYIDIGIECMDMLPSNWCIFDNFKLEYDGEIVVATDISVNVK